MTEVSTEQQVINELHFRLLPLETATNVAGVQTITNVPLWVVIEQNNMWGSVVGNTIADKYHAALWSQLLSTTSKLLAAEKNAALLRNTLAFRDEGYVFRNEQYQPRGAYDEYRRKQWVYNLYDPWGRLHVTEVPVLNLDKDRVPVVPLNTRRSTAPKVEEERVDANDESE